MGLEQRPVEATNLPLRNWPALLRTFPLKGPSYTAAFSCAGDWGTPSLDFLSWNELEPSIRIKEWTNLGGHWRPLCHTLHLYHRPSVRTLLVPLRAHPHSPVAMTPVPSIKSIQHSVQGLWSMNTHSVESRLGSNDLGHHLLKRRSICLLYTYGGWRGGRKGKVWQWLPLIKKKNRKHADVRASEIPAQTTKFLADTLQQPRAPLSGCDCLAPPAHDARRLHLAMFHWGLLAAVSEVLTWTFAFWS